MFMNQYDNIAAVRSELFWGWALTFQLMKSLTQERITKQLAFKQVDELRQLKNIEVRRDGRNNKKGQKPIDDLSLCCDFSLKATTDIPTLPRTRTDKPNKDSAKTAPST